MLFGPGVMVAANAKEIIDMIIVNV